MVSDNSAYLLGSIPRPNVTSRLILLLALALAPRVFSRARGFPSLRKDQNSKFQFNLKSSVQEEPPRGD